MKHDERLKRLAYNMGMQSSKDACLAGAEALRLLREYQEATAAVKDAEPETYLAAADRLAAARADLLATEVPDER